MSTIFIRVLEEIHNKEGALLGAIKQASAGSGRQVFEVDPATFRGVPGSPFAYWVSDSMRGLFSSARPFEADGRAARQGLATADDFRFVRTWWEVPATATGGQRRWMPFAKGGKYSPFYSDVLLCVNWDRDGIEISNFFKTGSDRLASRPQNTDYFGRPGLTWALRTKSELGVRVMPAGCAFGHKGPAAFVDGDSEDKLLALLAIMTSRAFRALVEFQLAAAEPTGRGGVARSYEVGVIQRTPVPNLEGCDTAMLSGMARRAWSLKRGLDASNETSHAFLLPLGLYAGTISIDRAAVADELEMVQRKIENVAFALYGIGLEDRAAIEASGEHGAIDIAPEDVVEDESDDPDEGGDSATSQDTASACASWLVGTAFGRFDPRLVTRERALPADPQAFDALAWRSPAMYPVGATSPRSPDVLVADEGHADDLCGRVQAVADRVRVDTPENLRGWLAKEFFPLHLRMYSKSRRKAPIYWQLSTPSASYSAWLFIHAFSKDTLFRVQDDYVAPKLAHEERRLEALRVELRDGMTVSQRKEAADMEAFVEELRALLEEVKRVAPLWNPDLDDGVIINFAPLWRLVPQNKAWQKELKATWDALCEGEYDWAHLAMHLWPERVVPKCAKDPSLAIAHGLEEVFLVEGSNGKLTVRKTPTRSVDDLICERASPAVKAALRNLLEAPVASAGNVRGRGGRRRGTTAADEEGR